MLQRTPDHAGEAAGLRRRKGSALPTCAVAIAVLAAWLALAPRAEALGLTPLGSFDQPVHVENAPGKKNSRLLFVVEKRGRVIVLRDGLPTGAPFLDISDLVLGPPGTEQGLLSVEFHPRYERNRLLYVYFTDRNGDNAVFEFRRKRRSRVRALRSSARRVLFIPHPDDATNHNGGQLQFGPKQLLYIGSGDGGSTPGAAQDRRSLRGKVLRIDPRKQRRGKKKGKRGRKSARPRPYGVPKGNPFAGSKPGRGEIYSLGLRNPFRFSFDRADGAIVIADVGAGEREEVNYRNRGAARGANFGWPRFEGTLLRDPGAVAPGALAPIHEYPTRVGGTCAIIGGFVIRDRRLASLLGRYLYTDLCRGQIRSLIPSQAGASGDAPLGVADVTSPSSFGEGVGGAIYVASLAGPVYRLDP